MKSEDLLRVIGDIDESYIAEADLGPVSKAHRWRRYTGWIITAAAAVLVILISVKLLRPVRKSEQLSSANAVTNDVSSAVTNAVTEDRAEKEKKAAADYDAMEEDVEEATEYGVMEEAMKETAGYDVVEEAAVEETADYDVALMAPAGTGKEANGVSGQRYTFEISSTREADTAEQGEWIDLAGKRILIEREGKGIRRARWENASGICTLTAEGEPFTREELEQLVEDLE